MKKMSSKDESREVVEAMADKIEQTLNAFDVPIKVVKAIEGLHQYHFHLKTLKPVRMKAIESFEQDLRYALGTSKVDIQAPLLDEALIGITVLKKDNIPLLDWSDAVEAKEFIESGDLVVPLGQDEFGEEEYLDIRRLPHLLIGGTTGSGKSILAHSFICSLILKHSPERLRFILVDPKRVELTLYNDIPHLLTPVITDAKKAVTALRWCIKEMERRLDVLQENRCQNIASYHQNVYEKSKKRDSDPEPLPYILVIVDELADLMHSYPKELEASVVRLTQMSRAVGIHLIFTTQRPSVNVITGLMKANIPSRIALNVGSQIDSRTILDMPGAEKLFGKGDMLYLGSDMPRPMRIQSYHISEQEVIANVKSSIKKYMTTDDRETLNLDSSHQVGGTVYVDDAEDDADLYEDARLAVIESGKASTSFLQRRLRIGYSRAARLIDMLEEQGVISPGEGSIPRKVISKKE